MNQQIGCLRYGLNAIVLRGISVPSREQRLARYHKASVAYPNPQLAAREQVGASLQAAWKDGKRPNLRLIRRVIAAAVRA